MKGRKRFILTDTQGLVPIAYVCSAAKSEKEGAICLMERIKERPVLGSICGRIKQVWADRGYRGEELITMVMNLLTWVWLIITQKEGQKGFEVLPRRWVVERTFAWLNHKRRLSKDYEKKSNYSENMIYIAMINALLKR
ncbi:MAG: transposase [Sphingobacteriales bacterium]|nr:MAG: transposase [Sphingobacteriales bacterium]